MKNVYIEATPLLSSKGLNKAGIPFYVENITKQAVKLDKKNHYTLFGTSIKQGAKELRAIFGSSVSYKVIRYIPSKVWNVANRKGFLPPLDVMLVSRPDVVIYTNFRRLPLLFGAQSMVVIHDITFAHHPQYIEKKNLEHLSRHVPRALKKATKIIAVSNFTKQDIVDTYGIDPGKIVVVSNAVDAASYKPTTLTKALAAKYKLPENYIFSLGTVEPRKNIARLLSAYNELSQELRAKYALVIGGGKGWLDEEIQKALADVKAPGKVVQLGYVDEEDLPAIYTGATVFAYPSLYEGFGLPILEAMGCGVPVVTGDNSSLPEAGGDAALYVNSSSVASIADGLTKVLSDQELRTKMTKLGTEHAKKFTWEKSAKVLVDEINKLSSHED